ncbi:MAG: 4-(cytidine 5'-diphospho)-2-C-methyl-D-erythritol kinase [Opitutaceae bacterium]|nr:4-(cytidine 5'-diphospho)-2-C-methyl-D-erythritol kinase [Cytophagales bacterium]
MITFPNIKINLGLYITGKRSDGYHDLLSCFYPVNWCDILEITTSETFEFIQTGIPVPGFVEDNLCVKAYTLIKAKHSIGPVRIHLHKIIPMGAGLGGGSSDAAYALKSLNSIFNLGLDNTQLKKYASEIGSDCAFFIENKPAIATSRGEVLELSELDLRGKYIVIVCPDIHISTKQAFSAIKPKPYSADFKQLLAEYSIWKGHLHNQFEDTILTLHPKLQTIKDLLYENGAFYASMSGSGSAMFGLFNKEPDFNLPGLIIFKGIL